MAFIGGAVKSSSAGSYGSANADRPAPAGSAAPARRLRLLQCGRGGGGSARASCCVRLAGAGAAASAAAALLLLLLAAGDQTTAARCESFIEPRLLPRQRRRRLHHRVDGLQREGGSSSLLTASRSGAGWRCAPDQRAWALVLPLRRLPQHDHVRPQGGAGDGGAVLSSKGGRGFSLHLLAAATGRAALQGGRDARTRAPGPCAC